MSTATTLEIGAIAGAELVTVGDDHTTHTLNLGQARRLCVALLVAIGDAQDNGEES